MNENRPDIYQANPLIEARKPMNTLETRLFLLALQDVNPHLSEKDKFYDKELKETFLTPLELKNIMGNGAYIPLLDEACDRLTQTNVCIRVDDENFEYYPLFEYIRYIKGEGLRIKLNSHMKQFVLEIFEAGHPYTRIKMQQIFYLQSSYAMRLLELMLQYQGTKQNNIIKRTLSIEDLRFMLNVEDGKYTRGYDFKRYVIDLSINEINEGTQYNVSYEIHKRGRIATAYTFIMDCSHVEQVEAKPTAKREGNLEMPPSPKDRHGLSKQAVVKLMNICGSKEEFELRMNYALELVAKRKKVDKPTAFIYRAIEHNYRQVDLDNQLAAERETQAIQDNYEWEQVAMEMFDESIPVNEDEPVKPFSGEPYMIEAAIRTIKRDLKEHNMGSSTRRILKEHNMSVKAFLEMYGGLADKKDDKNL